MIKRDRKLVTLQDKESKNLNDALLCGDYKPEGPIVKKGFCSVMDKDTGEFLVKNAPCQFGGTGKQNHILWEGREIIPQIMFGVDRDAGSLESQLRIRWLSVGTGGADAVNPLDPVAPESQDIGLNSEIVIDAANIAYTDAGKKKPFDSAPNFLQDDENDNRWLVAQVVTTLKYEEGNTNDINEACMWLSNSNDPTLANVFKAFARVTFSTIRKHQYRELVFLWYFYF